MRQEPPVLFLTILKFLGPSIGTRQHQLHRKESPEIADQDGDRIGKVYRLLDPVLAASSARCYVFVVLRYWTWIRQVKKNDDGSGCFQ
jgi:hypothetical protein